MNEPVEGLSHLTGLEGTGSTTTPPMFYRGLMRIFPPLVRSLTNVRYEGLERLPKKGPVILAGNHTSHIDPIVVIMGARQPVRYLAKTEHFKGGFTRFVMLSTGQIDTNRKSGASQALSSAVDVLEAGGWMGIFPEGTRSRRESPPYLQQGKTGIARLAVRFPHCNIIPVAILGARDFMQPGKAKIRFFTPIVVRIGAPVTFSQWIKSPNGGSINDSELKRILMTTSTEQQKFMGEIYRKFTDQFMARLEYMGAP
tara:strand:+ start:41562 stop:42326 length:765 start_codon:yes stop_codon:yes gene_type:complete